MSKDTQNTIPGTFDTPPEEVSELAERYASVLGQRMALQQEENTLKPQLTAAMVEHDLMTIPLDDGGTVNRKHIEDDKITVKSKSKDGE